MALSAHEMDIGISDRRIVRQAKRVVVAGIVTAHTRQFTVRESQAGMKLRELAASAALKIRLQAGVATGTGNGDGSPQLIHRASGDARRTLRPVDLRGPDQLRRCFLPIFLRRAGDRQRTGWQRAFICACADTPVGNQHRDDSDEHDHDDLFPLRHGNRKR